MSRCSRLCLTLFSWPEYVFTTYQRNIQSSSTDSETDGTGRPVDDAPCGAITASARPSKDEFHDFLGDEVGEPKVGAGDGDEAEHDGCGLADLAAVGPLYALKLGPAGGEEACDAVAAAQRSAGGTLGLAAATALSTG